tara:strand:- start:2072 stop:2770 length:699 start_codon:yes stop_codon:yes gene_type:complete
VIQRYGILNNFKNMSYTFSGAGGTTWGARTFNQIFALNSETVGAAEYWDKSNVEDYDTVICSTNNKVLVAKYLFRGPGDSTPVLYWFTTGVYLCQYSGSVATTPGTFMAVSSTNSAPSGNSVRPLAEISDPSGSTSDQFSLGITLVGGVNGDSITVATVGNWPVKRDGSVNLRNHAIPDTSAGELYDQSTNADGSVGKFYTTNFPIITSTSANPTTVDGAIVTLWGKNEIAG